MPLGVKNYTAVKRWRRKSRPAVRYMQRSQKPMGPLKWWWWNFWLAVDQLGSAITFGNADETISSRIGRLKLRHGGKVPWWRPLTFVLDHFLTWIDPGEDGHSIDAIEWKLLSPEEKYALRMKLEEIRARKGRST